MKRGTVKTQAIEDYLKAIFELAEHEDKVSTSGLAEHLSVSSASVTGMVKKLSEMKLVEHAPYQGVALTEAGRNIAVETIRHHRLVERYLHDALGVPWDQLHEEAEKWEHVLSEDLEARMDEALGHPTTDPHGAPIPSVDLTLPDTDHVALSGMEAGQTAVVAQVFDRDPELLRHVGGLGLYPDTPFEVVSVAPFDGPFTLRVGGGVCTLGRRAADHILVKQIDVSS